MSEEKALRKFNKVTTVNTNGELLINAGRFSRGAVVMAFEMIGGVETFAEWAGENKTEFYTKLLGKTIGREVETNSSDSVEEMLKVLDGEAIDVTDQEIEDVPEPRRKPPVMSKTKIKLIEAAQEYVRSEPNE